MKIGNIDIKKAFLGSLELTSKNAYIGNYKLINSEPEPEPITYDGLTFTAEQAGSTITYTNSSRSSAQYSLDGETWSDANNITITLANVGDKVFFKGSYTGNQSASNYASFKMTGLIAASGNINSLNNNSNSLTRTYIYSNLFKNCTSLTKAPELPATTLTNYCYQHMFYGCTSLTKVPAKLPATTLKSSCYAYMFYGCTSLTKAPELPATTLAINGYNQMFCGCTSLTKTPELSATTLTDYCYNGMFYNCAKLNEIIVKATSWGSGVSANWVNGVSATGDFYNLGGASDIPSGTSGIPSGWTVHTSL